MSREIRFRCWNNCLRKYIPEDELMDSFGECLKEKHLYIEQYTGLTDKNGKEIHEGDIVSVIGVGIAQVIDSPSGEWMLYYRREPDEINSGFVSVVPKNKPSGLWKTNTTSYIEVIGNIHENGELLGGEE